MRIILLSILFFFLALFGARGQEKCREVEVPELINGVELDSLSGIEESIFLRDSLGLEYPVEFDLNTNTVKLASESKLDYQFLTLCYRTFSIRFDQPIAKRTLLLDYDSMARFRDNRIIQQQSLDIQQELFPSTNLYKSGSLTRGVSVGNTQNVFVNSALNLQLEGKIAENLNIRASITDQNVPFQPEGNTQQIQDFDNVLIELYNDDFNLAAGDVVLQQRQSEFLRYYKNVQGLQLTSNYQLKGSWQASTQAFASIAKGKFASIQVPILEGVLGPYRLNGPNNERFVIIMANSEKVYLDGELLQRGFNADYVIDYNQAEITFTPKVLITQYSRVRVDFEYAERNYSRSIIGANHLQTNGKVDFYLNYYQERDNRNRPLFTDFNDEELRLLASVGDHLENARIPRIDSVAFDSNLILYERVEEGSLDGNSIVYYRYSTDPEVAHYDLSFSQVGAGNGDYRRLNQLSNGTVYEYQPRVNGQPQGDYSILTQLPAPDNKRMITAGSRIQLNEYEKIYTEVAFSFQDQNLFSEIDDENNKGLGMKVGIKSEGRKVDFLKGYTLKGETEYEYNSANFKFIDRFRYIEFDRDWGITNQELEIAATEQFFKAGVILERDRDNSFDYLIYLRNRNEILSGTQHAANWNLRLGKRVFLRNEFFNLQSTKDTTQSKWVRYQGNLSYRSRKLVPGYQFSVDRNTLRTNNTDSVLGTAMNFQEHLVYLESNDSLSLKFRADAAWREDKAPYEGVLVDDSRAFTSNFSLEKQWKDHTLRSTFTYRELEYLQRELQTEMTVMGKIDYLGSLGNNLIRNELSYALGNGRELQREFVFIPAPNGDGTHTWRDDNGDGVQQLNEFYLAINPEEKLYVKIFVPTDTYVQAYTTLLNYRIQAKFPESWKESGSLKKFLQKFSNTSSLNVEKKVTSTNFGERINPFIGGINREDILSIRQLIRSSFFFNRASATYGGDLSYFNSQWKQLLSGGFEDLIQKDWKLNTRYNFTNQTTLRILASKGERYSSSDFLENRNYRISQQSIGPEFVYQPSPNFRGTGTYSFTGKKNNSSLEFEERARIHQTGFDFRYSKAIKTTFNATLKWIEINYNGEVNSPVGYEMLQALTPGTNITWSLNWLQKIGEGLQVNMVYEGRNSQGLDRIVHVGRMQVTALF